MIYKERIHEANCSEIAEKIVSLLSGKTIDIVTTYLVDGVLTEAQSLVRDRHLSDHSPEVYLRKEGWVKIPLKPSRSIIWDISCEEVYVSFREDGVIVVERHLPKDKTIIRFMIFRD